MKLRRVKEFVDVELVTEKTDVEESERDERETLQLKFCKTKLLLHKN